MQIKKATRKKTKIKILISGVSGSGKTYSSLLLAHGLCGDWSKIVVIDTEKESASLYSHLGEYNILPLEPPFSPERYIEAITEAEKFGAEAVIIDSISHEWDGEGGVLDTANKMSGNSFTNWNKLTPRHNRFIEKILQSNCHVIATSRAKSDYILQDNEQGKKVPEKVGMKSITREGIEYEFTLCFEIDIHNRVMSTKDRTSLFKNKDSFVITEQTAKSIIEWCETGLMPEKTVDDLKLSIGFTDDHKNIVKPYIKDKETFVQMVKDLHDKMTINNSKWDSTELTIQVNEWLIKHNFIKQEG